MNSSFSDLSDSQLLDLCRADASVDPNCPCLISGGGPEINTDISGPGVRISFYLQALCLGWTSARSVSCGENTTSLYTLISTNIALVLTSFILGFKPEPAMSLHDAIVVFYLLGLSWVTIFFSIPTYNRFKRKDMLLAILYVVHSYSIFALFFAVLIKAQKFGSTPRCNGHAVVVLFGDIPALSAGRIIAFVAVGIAALGFTFLLYYDCRMNKLLRNLLRYLLNRTKASWEWTRAKTKRTKRTGAPTTGDEAPAQRVESSQALILWRPNPWRRRLTCSESSDQSNDEKENQQEGGEKGKARRFEDPYSKAMEDNLYLTGIDGRLVISLVIIVILWGIFVMNSELLIKRNRFKGGGDGISPDLWGFGQIFPLLVIVLPLVNLVSIFRREGLRKPKRQKRRHRVPDPEAAFAGGLGDVPHENAPGSAHRTRFDYGPRRPRPAWNKDGRGTRADFIPSFFSNRFGQQPDAHISAESLHSTSPKYAEFAGASRADKGKGRAKPARRQSTSSASEFDSGDESV